MRLHIRALSVTGAIVATTAYVVGGIIHVLSPWGAPAVVSYLFHVDIIQLGIPFAWDSFVVGAVVMAGVGAILAAFAGLLYNKIVSREKNLGFTSAPAGVPKS